jgi:hypothetical protein
MKGMPHYRQYPMGDVVNANLEPGEYVVRRNAVNSIGKDNMELLNQADGAHGALNKLMVSASLVNLQPQDNSPVKIEANGFPIADSPVRQRVDATRNMQKGGEYRETAEERENRLWPDIDLSYRSGDNRLAERFLEDHGYRPYMGQGSREFTYEYTDKGLKTFTPYGGVKSGIEQKTFTDPTFKVLRDWMGYQEGGVVRGYQGGGLIDKFKQSLVDDRGLFRGERGEPRGYAGTGGRYRPSQYQTETRFEGAKPLNFEGEKSQFHGLLGRLADRRLRKDIEGVAADFRREYAPQGEGPYYANVRHREGQDPSLMLGYSQTHKPHKWNNKEIEDMLERSGKRGVEIAERNILGYTTEDVRKDRREPETSDYYKRAESAYQRRADAPSNIFQLLGGLGKKKGSPAEAPVMSGEAQSAPSESLSSAVAPSPREPSLYEGMQQGGEVRDVRPVEEGSRMLGVFENGEQVESVVPPNLKSFGKTIRSMYDRGVPRGETGKSHSKMQLQDMYDLGGYDTDIQEALGQVYQGPSTWTEREGVRELGRNTPVPRWEYGKRGAYLEKAGYQTGGEVRDVPSGNWGPKGAYNEALRKAREEDMGSNDLKSLSLLEQLRLLNAGTGVEPERLEQLNPERPIKRRESLFESPDSSEYNMPTLEIDPSRFRTPIMRAPSDNYSGSDVKKNLNIIIPYLQSYGRMKTPAQERDEFLYGRLGVDPENPPMQLQGLKGRALLQQYGNEQQ